MKNTGLEKAMARVGGARELARLLGISKQAIYKWTKVPASQIIRIEKATGVPRELLRPELYERG